MVSTSHVSPASTYVTSNTVPIILRPPILALHAGGRMMLRILKLPIGIDGFRMGFRAYGVE